DMSVNSVTINDTSAVTIAGGQNTLTLGTGGITVAATATNPTISARVALGAAQTWNIGSGRTMTVSGIVSGLGTSGLTKTGACTLSLSGDNAYLGTTTLSDGKINLGVAESAGVSGPLGMSTSNNPGSIVLNGGTLQYSGSNQVDYSGRFSTAANQQYNVD